MAITRKPKVQELPASIDVDALINKGGSVATASRNDPDAPPPAPSTSPVTMTVRIPGPLLTRIDAVLKRKPVKMPRHTWMLEALVEKLERETE